MTNQKSNNPDQGAKVNDLAQQPPRNEPAAKTRKATSGQLEAELAFQKCVIEQAAEGICVCHAIANHPFVRFTLWNPRMTTITGYTMKQINRIGWYQAMYPDPELQKQARQRMEGMRSGEDLHNERWTVTRADGKQRILGISTSVWNRSDDHVNVIAIMQDISDREEINKLKRTQQTLNRTLNKLEKEIEQRTRVENKLIEANKTLEEKIKKRTAVLEETNAALKVILNQREQDKKELAESITTNLNELVYPYFRQLNQTKISTKQKKIVEILQANLAQVMGPFVSKLTFWQYNLTHTEIRVADLIRNGLSNKEIAESLGVSINTILTHRHHIRNKLELKNKKINLRSFLKSLQQ